ncbi:phenylalanine--tRNA ligase alpha subunit-like isoform X2 [Oscarella lobularis]|uniref:phenylalanine--tRNA ligase alpha subunit-like isoform X2 n=1 Tax=Oscarella lobularis TaxID=121494 RepID=UPI003313D591
MAEELDRRILAELDVTGHVNSYDFATKLGVDHQLVVGAVKSLQSVGDVIHVEQKRKERWETTGEGNEVAERGSHEAIVFHAVDRDRGTLQADLMKSSPNAKVGFSKAMSAGWIRLDKEATVHRKVESITDTVQELLKAIRDGRVGDATDAQLKDLKKRKLVSLVIIKSLDVTKGTNFSTSVQKLETDLTPEMLTAGNWKDKKFKEYNFDARGVLPASGHLHPLLKVRTEYRQIFLEMGFTEMPTNNFVESSFWNFDALFQPQQHPARDAHDTFFIKEPKCAHEFPMDYLERVKKVHSEGGYGSQGYKYDWKIEEAKKNILRTHTTAVSARMLYKLAQVFAEGKASLDLLHLTRLSLQDKFKPVKYFSIDRVFRNETLDATHLAEFHQIEGVVADYDLTLGDLIGVLHQFFSKLGIKKLRFKPAYNPYTEPSMEVFSYHEGLKKWVEVGNSGVFRPEMLRPMGLPDDVSVIAWGLSLERPTMIKYGIDNIRDLIGHKVNLQMVYDNPLCRLNKTTKT